MARYPLLDVWLAYAAGKDGEKEFGKKECDLKLVGAAVGSPPK